MIDGECKRAPNLILYMSIYLREVHGERRVAVMGVDFGGNTDLAVRDDYWCTTEPEFQAFSRAACQRRWSLMKVEMK